jgi:hypothetical protein
MDLVSLLATVILFATIGTLIAAVAAYAAYKLREKRKPAKGVNRDTPTASNEPMFVRPYVPPTPDTPDNEPRP